MEVCETGPSLSGKENETEEGKMSLSLIKQGAEARIFVGELWGKPCLVKERFPKTYRHPTLDKLLTSRRTKSEVRTIMRCRACGIKTPAVYFVDLESHKIYMEYFTSSVTVRDHIAATQRDYPGSSAVPHLTPLAKKIGQVLGVMHSNNIIHGDLTTSNMLLMTPTNDLDLIFIDFGLGYTDSTAEDKGVDLYVLERALLSTHPDTEALFTTLLDSYKTSNPGGSTEVIRKLDEVRLRGRKRTMVG